MITPEVIEKTQQFLFATEEEMIAAGLTTDQQKRLIRIRDMYTYWLRTPSLGDKAIADECRRRYAVSVSQAYEDIRIIKVCLGNLNQASKDYYRWLFLARCEEGFQMAREKQDPNAFARVLGNLGKYTRLDTDDKDAPDWSKLIPQNFEITDNPEAAGYKRTPNIEQLALKMWKRYVKEAEEAEYVEVPDETKSLP